MRPPRPASATSTPPAPTAGPRRSSPAGWRRVAWPPGAVTVGSKWGYTYTAGWRVDADRHEVKDHSLATLRRQSAESRAILGGRLDLYQIHSATLDSGVLDDRDVLEELARLRGGRAARSACRCPAPPGRALERAMAVERRRAAAFDCVQATWNLLERRPRASLDAAQAAGDLGVIVKEALANGRLVRGREAAPAPGPWRRGSGAPLDAVALAAALERPWADVVLSGAATVDQLPSNAAAADLVLDAAARDALAALAMPVEVYWRSRVGACPGPERPAATIGPQTWTASRRSSSRSASSSSSRSG